MAGLYFTLKKEITLSASVGPITLVQLVAPSNQRVEVVGADVSMNGVTSSDPPVLFEILTQSTAGTMSALTPGKVNPSDSESVQSTAQHTAVSEPTAGTVICGEYISSLTGGFIPLPNGVIPVAGAGRLGIRYTSGALTGTVKACITLTCRE